LAAFISFLAASVWWLGPSLLYLQINYCPAAEAAAAVACPCAPCCPYCAAQSCAVLAISVFGSTLETVYQCTLFTAAFGSALVLLAVFKPFAQHLSNLVGIQSLGCLILTTQAALVLAALAASDAEEASRNNAAAATAVGALVLCVNAVFVLSFMWQVVRLVDWRAMLIKASRATAAAAARLCSSCSMVGK
jgi:hypothetical protein